MKRVFHSVILLVLALFLFGSCLKSNSDLDIVYNDDTAIESFSVATVKQTMYALDAYGEDSAYVKDVDMSKCNFYIDQASRTVYNPDSLPLGVDASRVLCNAAAKDGGMILVNIKTKDKSKDSLVYFSNTDSLDFTEPLEFQVYNNAGTAYRSYMVKVNVHKEDGNTFGWASVGTNADLGALTAMKSVSVGNNIYVFGNNGSSTVVYSTANTDGSTWTLGTQTFGAEAYKSACAYSDMLYIADAGTIYSSADGNVWTQIGTADVKQLLGGSPAKLYALMNDNTLAASADGGVTWAPETLGNDAALLPSTDINFCYNALITNPDTYRLWIVGNRDEATYADDATSMVWNKIEENAQGSENQSWVYYNVSSDNQYAAPRLTNIQVNAYNGGMMAFGGSGIGASDIGAFKAFYFSYDGGITWHADTIITTPQGFNSSNSSFAVTVDINNYIWIVAGTSGQVWKGRLTSLGWKEEETIFTE